jgi:hypothetical protein
MTDGPSPVMADRLGGGRPLPHLYLWTMPRADPRTETLPVIRFCSPFAFFVIPAKAGIQRLSADRPMDPDLR